MKGFAQVHNENSRMHLTYVDWIAQDNNGLKYLVVPQDLFDRVVDAQGLKRKSPKEIVWAIPTINTKKSTQENWVNMCTEYAGDFQKHCKAKGKQTYFTMNEIEVHLVNVQNEIWKKFSTVTWKTMGKSTVTNWLNP